MLKMYVGHDGQKHAGVNVRVQELELCGSKAEYNNPANGSNQSVTHGINNAHQDAQQTDGASDEQLAF